MLRNSLNHNLKVTTLSFIEKGHENVILIGSGGIGEDSLREHARVYDKNMPS